MSHVIGLIAVIVYTILPGIALVPPLCAHTRLERAGGLVRDVPIPARYGSETSYLRVQRALFEFPRFLARGAIRRLWMRYFVYDFTAVSLFLVSGLLFMAFGVSFGTVKWIQSVSTGVPATAGTVILAALPVLMGFNLLLQALILDIQSVPNNKMCRDLPGGSV